MIDWLANIIDYIPSIITFVVIFSVLIIVHEWGHFFAAKKSGIKVEEFALGLGKKLWGKQKGETKYRVNAIPFGGYVKMLGEEESSNDPRSFEQASLLKRIWITLNGIFMNLVFTILIFTFIFSVGTTPILLSEADVKQAESIGIIEFNEGTEDSKRTIKSIQKIQKPIWQAFPYAINETSRISKFIVQKIAEIPRDVVREGGVPESLAGPVGIAQATHQILPEGIMAILKLTALLSLSLGVMNFLPIPALDGGRFLFQIIEFILMPFKVKLNKNIENTVHMIGYFALLGLLFLITGNDILKLF